MSDVVFEVSRATSMLAFAFYGVHCLRSASMATEFERYGLARFRVLTGSLELAGAGGLLVGYAVPLLTVLASAGLSLLMFLGVLTRIRIRDPLTASVPAFVLLVLNAYVCFAALRGDSA